MAIPLLALVGTALALSDLSRWWVVLVFGAVSLSVLLSSWALPGEGPPRCGEAPGGQQIAGGASVPAIAQTAPETPPGAVDLSVPAASADGHPAAAAPTPSSTTLVTAPAASQPGERAPRPASIRMQAITYQEGYPTMRRDISVRLGRKAVRR